MEKSPDLNFKDYYKILGLKRDCQEHEIKKNFRLLARKYHPDTNKDDRDAEKKIKDLNEAYEVLSDPERRKMYDSLSIQDWHKKVQPDNKSPKKENNSFSSFFHSLFGSVKDTTLKNLKKINNLEKNLYLTLEEALEGSQKEIELITDSDCNLCNGEGILNNISCQYCKGTGTVSGTRIVTAKIPTGVTKNSRLIISGEGSGTGLLRGDLILNIKIKDHRFFSLEENGIDVSCTLPISLTEAVIGTDIEVPTLKGSVKMKIPPGTQNDQLFRIKGRGLADKKNNLLGDQYVKINVIVPRVLSARENELYRELFLIDRLSPRDEIYQMMFNETSD